MCKTKSKNRFPDLLLQKQKIKLKMKTILKVICGILLSVLKPCGTQCPLNSEILL
jgi:hypothetical protein